MITDEGAKNAQRFAAECGKSEFQLRLENPILQEMWEMMMALKMEISEKKRQALRQIDEEYEDRVKEIEQEYAIMLKLVAGD